MAASLQRSDSQILNFQFSSFVSSSNPISPGVRYTLSPVQFPFLPARFSAPSPVHCPPLLRQDSRIMHAVCGERLISSTINCYIHSVLAEGPKKY